MSDLVRLLLDPVPIAETQSGPEQFDASREDTGKHVVRSAQPLYAGARVLLDGGTLPTVLLTTRHRERSHDNFIPVPIGQLAQARVKEGQHGLRAQPYRSFRRKP